jgi:hypothetical protein
MMMVFVPALARLTAARLSPAELRQLFPRWVCHHLGKG